MNVKTISRFFGLFASVFFLLVSTNISAQTKEALSSLLTMDQTEVNPIVLKSFEKRFENANALNWYKATGNNVLAKYRQNDQTQYALFTAKGTLIRQFTYGTERNLPVAIKNLFNEKYWNVTVVNVANVKQDSRDFWIIYAEKGNHSFAVAIEDGEVEEL
jgi:hypothetical protein